jgi:hypothetical protein
LVIKNSSNPKIGTSPQWSHPSAGSNGGTTTLKIGIRPTALRRTPGVINTAPAGILAMFRVARKRGG